jgi:DNA-binding GntR family transcriptional regulator
LTIFFLFGKGQKLETSITRFTCLSFVFEEGGKEEQILLEKKTEVKDSLTDRAYKEIKNWIIHYKLKPGVQLRIDELSTALGMSQTPVREALSKLEHEHLADRHPQKGYVVRALNLKDVSDIYDLRMALEVVAAEEAATRMGDADRSRLSHLLEQVDILIKKGEKAQVLALEQEFHMRIMEATGNWFLTEILGSIFDRIWMIQNVNILTSDHLIDANKQHMEIYKALKKADPLKSAALMKKHLKFTKKFVLSRLQDSDDFLSKLIMGFPESGQFKAS